MTGIFYLVFFFVRGLETHLNMNNQIPAFIHSVCLWFILPFVIVPFLILLYMENKTVQIRRQMLLFAILGFILGFLIFK